MLSAMKPLGKAMKSLSAWLIASSPLLAFLNTDSNVHALRILIGNEDSWGTANIRALFNVLKEAGHDVVISAPVTRQLCSGTKREQPSRVGDKAEFALVHEGADALGRDPKEERIRYVNSTPCTSIAYGISTAAPRFFDMQQPDLVIAGVSEGNNCGKSCIAWSGTFGIAQYIIATTGIPAIAVSAANKEHRDYRWLRKDDDQAYKYAHATLALVTALEAAASKRAPPPPPSPALQRSGSMHTTGSSRTGSAHADGSNALHRAEIFELEQPPPLPAIAAGTSTANDTPLPRARLLPPNLGLNVNLADADGVSKEQWMKKWWIYTRMFKSKWERRIPCLILCDPIRLPPEERGFRLSKSDVTRGQHTISVFRVNSTTSVVEPTKKDIDRIAYLLQGRLPHFHYKAEQSG